MNIKKDIENYIYNYLSKPNNRFHNNLQPCPFAKKALLEDKVSIIEVSEANKFWDTVAYECENFSGDKEVIIVACKNSFFELHELIGGCDALNNFFAVQKKDLWLLSSQNFANAMILIQKLSLLDDASKTLEQKDYYNSYPKESFNKHVLNRRKIRQKSTLMVDKNLNKQYNKQ